MSNTIIMYENGKAIGGEGHPISGGGHVIEDNDGTDMPQEENLQFVGVYTEDDATNDRTKVNIVREMTSTQMQSLTSAQKKGFIHTTDEPDNPYNKSYTLLWENSNPSATFTNQTITLASDDYDFLMIIAKWHYTTNINVKTVIAPKGYAAEIEFAIPSDTGARVVRRFATPSSDNLRLTFSNGLSATGTSALIADQSVCIPIKIYGLKF